MSLTEPTVTAYVKAQSSLQEALHLLLTTRTRQRLLSLGYLRGPKDGGVPALLAAVHRLSHRRAEMKMRLQ